jgi:pimeloyl-ACP methyl ester carboxylesterase
LKVEIEPGLRLYFDVEGMGLVPDGNIVREKPTLVLLHGGPGMDHQGWKPHVSPLVDLVQILYIDQRGHGRSDRRPAAEWTLDCWADDVVRLCDALGIVRPIVWGQSFGGMVAQHYLARHPSHPAKVILTSCSPHLGLARKLAVFERLGGQQARRVAETYWLDPSTDHLQAYLQVCMPLYNTNPQPNTASSLARFNTELLDTWNRTELPGLNLLPGLARATCPVLVLGGEEDPVTPIEDQRDIARALPAGCVEFHAVSGAGHGIWRDRPEPAMALLRRFISAPLQDQVFS